MSKNKPNLSMLSAKLTKREQNVCDLLKLGYDNSEIAKKLHISLHTVRSHLKSIHLKLGVRTRSKLLAVLMLSDNNISLLGKLKIDDKCVNYKAKIDKLNKEHEMILNLLEKFLLLPELSEINTGYFKWLVSEHFRNEEVLFKLNPSRHEIEHKILENIIDKAFSSNDFKSSIHKTRKAFESHLLDWDMNISPPCANE
jgi:DNA-binding CsgD family transcriptional regulator